MKINYDVVDFSDENFKKLLLRNPNCLKSPQSKQINYFKEYLDKLGCKKIIVEDRYVDQDYLDDFSHFYVRCFQDYERFCTRLHFFIDIEKTSFEELLAGKEKSKEIEKWRNQYLGFMVVKPLPAAVIGRSVLRPYPDSTMSIIGDENESIRSIRCLRKYSANLAGIDLMTYSVAFQEQDSVLATCATSALWSAFQVTSHLFNHHIPTQFEITSCATKYFQRSRSIPSEGLNAYQMCQAVKEMGLEIELREIFQINDDALPDDDPGASLHHPLLSASYGYLRAGIPVVLGVRIKGDGFHAITILGYKLGKDGPGFDELRAWHPDIGLKLKGSRIVKFYAHDDQIGPFSKIEVKPSAQPDKERKEKSTPSLFELWSDWKNKKQENAPFIPMYMLVPLYHKIRVPFVVAIERTEDMQLLLEKVLPGKSVEWDVFLSSLNDYKREISNQEKKISDEVRGKILTAFYPRFFWRARAFVDNTEVCEMIIDATDMEFSFQLEDIHVFDQNVLSGLKAFSKQHREQYSTNRKLYSLLRFIDEEMK